MSISQSSRNALKSRFKTLTASFKDRDFNRQNFNLFIQSLTEKHYASSYINNFIKLGKHLDHYLKTGILDDYTYFKESRTQIKIDTLSFEEMSKLAHIYLSYHRLSTYLNIRNQAIVLLLSCTGMRIGELLGLTWDDLAVIGEIYTVTLRNTKNGEDRTNVITKECWNLIDQLDKKEKRVFGMNTSFAIAPDLNKRAEACGINKRIFPHLFRHSFITEMRKAGATYEQIAPITGHKDINILKNRYDHVLLKDVENTLYNFNPLFGDNESHKSFTQRFKVVADRMVNTKKYSYQWTEDKDSFGLKCTRND